MRAGCRGSGSTAQNEHQRAPSPESYACHLFPRDRLTKEYGSKKHCPQRHTRGDYRRVGRRRQFDPKDETALIEHYGKKRRGKQTQHVARRHVLRSLKQRHCPEQHHRAGNAQIGEHKRRDHTASHNNLGKGRHQAPTRIRQQHRAVAFPTEFFHNRAQN